MSLIAVKKSSPPSRQRARFKIGLILLSGKAERNHLI